jgi:putative membrane protein
MLKVLLINSIVIFLCAWLLEGVKVKNFFSAIAVAVVLAIVNTFIKPLVVLLTLPLTILTLGLFVLVINAWILMFIGKLIDGFEIKSFWWALICGILFSVMNGILLKLL